jgi:L-arabonate dehydrase
MEDLFYAGGLPVVLKALDGILHRDCHNGNGKPFLKITAMPIGYNSDVITTTDAPFNTATGLAILTGNLCPKRRGY